LTAKHFDITGYRLAASKQTLTKRSRFIRIATIKIIRDGLLSRVG
jgi:hypothetical protein